MVIIMIHIGDFDIVISNFITNNEKIYAGMKIHRAYYCDSKYEGDRL